MQVFRRLLQRIATLASMLMLAAALLPALSQASSTSDAFGWASVCTAQGKTPGSGSDRPDTGAGLFDHCPLCAINLHGTAPPPDGFTLGLPAGRSAPPPECVPQLAHTRHACRSGLARAPPVAL